MIVWMILGMLLTSALVAQEVPAPSPVQSQIQALDTELNKLTDQLDTLAGTSKTLSQEIGQIELQRAVLHGKIEKHELQLKQADQQIQGNEERMAELEAVADQQRERIGQRLRQLYKRGHLGHAQLLLKQSRLTELINAYHYARFLTKRDQEALAAYAQTRADIAKVTNELVSFRANATQARADLDREQVSLKALLAERAKRLKEIRLTTEKNLQLLDELELEKEELVLLVRRQVETDADPMKLRVPITRYKGRLEWPVQGHVRRRFGIYKDPEFGTRQKQNGLAIGVVEGSSVKAVYSGRVLFADWFKSYGNVIILDHGENVITFYAHLQKAAVARNDFVEKGQVIALSGDTGSLDGPMLHFEIRNKAEPENPEDWLK